MIPQIPSCRATVNAIFHDLPHDRNHADRTLACESDFFLAFTFFIPGQSIYRNDDQSKRQARRSRLDVELYKIGRRFMLRTGKERGGEGGGTLTAIQFGFYVATIFVCHWNNVPFIEYSGDGSLDPRAP